MNAHDVAQYLQENPEFFERHADLFASLRVPSPHGGSAVSLAERQVGGLRDRLRASDARLMELVRNARENEIISENMFFWLRGLLIERDPLRLPDMLTKTLASSFTVPDVALRLWGVDNAPAEAVESGWAQPVPDDVRSFVNSLMAPYCGLNSGFAVAGWLSEHVRSMALIPLRVGVAPQAFGLLVLGSPDPERFAPSLGTGFLARIGELSSASLSRLLPR
ncbi:DUF484 family protein [Pigmentiphaga aceris]|uniref:DUF484 family protein n=1 Tax=Pigmentiphaga aceris TaxID=1940612 RepID=A0A5C0AVY4_9BURK|nr:DUF484 family protein [Pigmentiphaga aceris]QEI04841.1 DUF484 family protein [Pigmentiphaga aceris]